MEPDDDASASGRARQLALVTAAGRVAGGLGVFARPAVLARALGVDRGSAERTAFVARLFAAREVAIGAGTLWALLRGRPTGPWLAAAAVGDAGDAIAFALAARDGRVAPARGWGLAAFAVSGVVGGVVTAWGTRGDGSD